MYIAHKSDDGRVQSIKEHLLNTSALAKQFAHCFGAESIAEAAGLYHDLGKYSDSFQKRINGGTNKTDHATAGGKLILKTDKIVCGRVLAYLIFSHHTGLINGGSDNDTADAGTFCARCKKETAEDVCAERAVVENICLPEILLPAIDSLYAGFSVPFLIRMLFSALTDADFIDTENFMNSGTISRGGYAEVAELLIKLRKYVKPFLESPSNELNEKRTQILKNCVSKAENKPGIFTFTSPTGSGKTISSLSFALEHAEKYGKSRVIYVIPYTTIIEQNAKVFSDILGEENVVEHHFNIICNNYDEVENKKVLSSENWDAPVIVTTNVQFFQSLFGNRTSVCRKLHNIANSVIIFDEAQMLPIHFLKPCTAAIAELVRNYSCTAVLCTATQSSLDSHFAPLSVTEITEKPREVYEYFRRVTIKNSGTLTDAKLSERLNCHNQVLCVVNTRKQARNIYFALDKNGSFHLSTRMYPVHREKTMSEIRRRLKENLPCRVVSTSLVEAGVDLDFPVLYREKSGLDSIIQAAGRCNREGNHSAAESFVYIFGTEYNAKAGDFEQRKSVYEGISRKYEDVASLEAVSEYFNQLFYIKGDSALDSKCILKRLEKGVKKNGMLIPFKDIAEDFRLIEEDTRALLIPSEKEARVLTESLRKGERGRNIFRKVGRYSVNVYINELAELKKTGAVEEIDENIFVLADLNMYDGKAGLNVNFEGGNGIFM